MASIGGAEVVETLSERSEEVTVVPGPRRAHCGWRRCVATMVIRRESKTFTRLA